MSLGRKISSSALNPSSPFDSPAATGSPGITDTRRTPPASCPSSLSLLDLRGYTASVYDTRSSALTQYMNWKVRALSVTAKTENSERLRPSFPISYLRTRMNEGKEENHGGGEVQDFTHRSVPQLPSSSRLTTPRKPFDLGSSLLQDIPLLDEPVKHTASSYPTERRSSIETTFSFVSSTSSDTLSHQYDNVDEISGEIERNWSRVDPVSVASRAEEDKSSWSFVKW